MREELSKIAASIRHECTGYNKLKTFYSYMPDRRKQLNIFIHYLIVGKITYLEFQKQVSVLEDEVNLMRRVNKKKFLQHEKKRIKYYMPEAPSKDIAKIAQLNLSKILKNQYLQNLSQGNGFA